jgi:hypothetical protein
VITVPSDPEAVMVVCCPLQHSFALADTVTSDWLANRCWQWLLLYNFHCHFRQRLLLLCMFLVRKVAAGADPLIVITDPSDPGQ